MRAIKDRKEFFTLLEAVNESNRDYFSRFGNWHAPQTKVFWLEVNEASIDQVIGSSDMKRIGTRFFQLIYEYDLFWLDLSDKRIWQIFTFATSEKTNRMIDNLFTTLRGVDRVWLTERFMKNIQERLGYTNRGFGIKFRDILSLDDEIANFSAKFWIGKKSKPAHKQFLEDARRLFSISTLRFGIDRSEDGRTISGQLYELYYNGHLTATTTEDIESLIHLTNEVRKSYKDYIIYLENEAQRKPSFVEIEFSEEVDRESFDFITNRGAKDLRLWLQPYQHEEDLLRFSGVDLHTGDFVNLDMSDTYSYISAARGSCMNIAPRFGTLSSRYLSSSAAIYHDGVELFA